VPRLTRRPLAAALLACAALIPATAGCEAGLNAPTIDFHPAAAGATTFGAGITISNAFVLGSPLGQTLPAASQAGVFLSIASINGDTLQSVSAPGVASSVKVDGGSISIPANGVVNLTGPTPRIVLTNLSAALNGGQTVTLVLDFATVGKMQLQVPVEPQAYDYATYEQPPAPAPSPTATAASTGTATASPAAKHVKHPHAARSASPSATP